MPDPTARRLRILHVVPTYWPAVRYGGPIRSVHGLAAAQSRLGHDVHVSTTSMDGPDDLRVPLDTPVHVDGVQVRYFPVPHFRRLHVAPELARQLRREIKGFDVVHLHSVFLWPTWMAARAAHRAGIPYIVAPRGMLVRDIIRRKSRWLKQAWVALVERRTLEQASRLHVTAHSEAQELRAQNFLTAPIVVIPNGVTFPDGSPVLSQGPFKGLPQRYALFLSRISWKKGLDRLLQAWTQVPELPLVIAGNDEEGYQHKLEAMARRLGISERVLFVGPARDEDKWALYAQAEVFLLPSYSENFGIVVAEAMAMGCPVIVTPDVGAGELVVQAEPASSPQGSRRYWRPQFASFWLPGRRQRQGLARPEIARTQLSWRA